MTIKRLTVSQAVCLSVMTGTLLLDPMRFRKEIGKKLGREITKEEFTNPHFIKELQGLYNEELQKMCDVEEDSGLVLPT